MISGYYGFGNAGDEIILRALLADVREIMGDDVHVTVVSGDPADTSRAHGVSAVEFKDIRAIISAIGDSDAVILGGGGLFHDYWGVDTDTLLTPLHGGIAYYAGIAVLATALDKPLMIAGVGVGPLRSAPAKRLTRAVFEAAAVATVRDESSRRELQAAGVDPQSVTVTADLAFRANGAPLRSDRIPSNTRRPLIAVALRNWSIGVTPSQWEREFARGLDLVLDRDGGTVVFIPFQQLAGVHEDDVAVCTRVRDRMRHKDDALLAQLADQDQLRAALAACDAAVAMRLHSLVLAIQAHVPAIPVVYDPKMADLAQRAGLESMSLDVTSLEATDLAERVRRALEDADAMRRSEQAFADEMNANAAKNTDALRRFVETRKEKTLSGETANALKRALVTLASHLAAQAESTNAARETLASREQQLSDIQQREAGLFRTVEEMTRNADASTAYTRSLESSLQNINHHADELRKQLEQSHEDLARAQEETAAARAETKSLRSDAGNLAALLDIKQQQAAFLETKTAQQAAGIDWLRGEVDMREEKLQKIYGSRWWRVAGMYWRARAGAARVARPFTLTPKEAALKVGRRVLPRSVKRYLKRFWDPNQSLTPAAIASAQLAATPGQKSDVSLPSTYDVICFSIIDWSFRWQRPQQVMARLAREGHRVFFMSTTQFLPPGGTKFEITPLRENVWELKIALPRALDVYGGELPAEMAAFIADDLDGLRRECNINIAVSFVQVPTWSAAAYAARRRFGWKVVYDCMDEWNTFPGMKQPLLEAEKELVREADVVVVTAQRLVEKWHDANPRLLLARNAADFDHYSNVQPNDLLAHLPHPIVGYFGAIADWFDLPLMIRLAKERPQYSFVLIGGIFNVPMKELEKLPNVSILGQKPYDLMPKYLYHFDVCIIPFVVNAVTEATDPVKFYEYISMGKPVVAPRMPELYPYRDLLYIGQDADDFLRKVDTAVAEDDPSMPERRIELARRNTWAARVADIKERIADAHEKISIIIVTYHNLDYTKLCIDSVFRNTLYPNFEVIIVDNASNDGTPDYLKQVAAEHDNVRIILNKHNFGFARANNQGIAVSSGDAYVLLNNDTVAPNGWLPRLARHLAQPELGLIVTVTNFSGNESRIDVPYKNDLAAMEQFAARYTHEHEGEMFDIRVAAMYCVAIRRDVYEKVGPLDEQFSVGMFEDDDYSERMRRAGYRVVCVEDVFIHHFGQASFKKLSQSEYQAIWDRNKKLYEKKWGIEWKPHTLRAGVR